MQSNNEIEEAIKEETNQPEDETNIIEFPSPKEADFIASPLLNPPLEEHDSKRLDTEPITDSINFPLPCCNAPACPSTVYHPMPTSSVFNTPVVSAIITTHERGVRCRHCKTYQTLFMKIDPKQGLPLLISVQTDDPNPPKVMPATLSSLAELQKKVRKPN